LGSREVLSAAFSLAVGEESGWISSTEGVYEGHYKIRVSDQKAGRALTLEESKDELKRLLTQQKATDAAKKKLNDLTSKITDGDLEKAVKGLGLEVKVAPNFRPGQTIAGVGNSSDFDQMAIQTPEGQISDAFVVPSGAAILKNLKNAAIDEKKFSEEKEKLRGELEERKGSEEMRKLLETLRKGMVVDTEMMKKLAG
jgi:hypothetical protein